MKKRLKYESTRRSENFAGWLCDTYDEGKAFFTKPYFLERLFAPFNAVMNELSDRRSQRREKKAAQRANTSDGSAKAPVMRGLRVAAAATLGIAVLAAGTVLVIVNVPRYIDVVRGVPASVSYSDGLALTAEQLDQYDDMEQAKQIARESLQNNVAPASGVGASSSQAPGVPYTSTPAQAGAGGGSEIKSSTPGLPPGIPASRLEVYYHDKDYKVKDLSTVIHKSGSDEDHRVLLVDVSSNQGKIDWPLVGQTEVKGAMIRVGYRGRKSGDIYSDSCFDYNIKEAKAAGLKVGVYFYSQAITVKEAVEEAEFLLKAIEPYEFSLPVAIDYEYESMSVYGELSGRLYEAGLDRVAATNVVEAFCKKVEDKAYPAMVYANKDMLTNSIDGKQLAEKYKVWLACYSNKADYANSYSYWQFTDKGNVYGIKGHVCLDYWYKA